MLIEGQVIGGRYRLEELLHDGGAAVVWSARDEQTSRRVAVKLLSDRLPNLPEQVDWFTKRARAATNRIHPAFIVVEDIGETDTGQPFVITPLLEITSLRRLLESGGPMAPFQAASLIQVVLQAVAVLHQVGGVHGDLKPENIFVKEGQRGDHEVRIINLGLSRPMLAEPSSTRPARVLGTLDYSAPERLRAPGAEPSPAMDVFAVGVMLSELFTGHLPLAPLDPEDRLIETKLADRVRYFLASSVVPLPAQTLSTLSPQLNDVVRRATMVDPRARFADAGQMLEALARAIAEDEDLRTTSTDSSFSTTSPERYETIRTDLLGDEPTSELGAAKTIFNAAGFDVAQPLSSPTEMMDELMEEDTDLTDLGDVESLETDVMATGFSQPPLCDDDNEGDTLATQVVAANSIKPPNGSPLGDPFAEDDEDDEPPSGYARTVILETPGAPLSTAAPGEPTASPHRAQPRELEPQKTQIFNPASSSSSPPPAQKAGLPQAAAPSSEGGLAMAKTMLIDPGGESPTMLLDKASPAMKALSKSPSAPTPTPAPSGAFPPVSSGAFPPVSSGAFPPVSSGAHPQVDHQRGALTSSPMTPAPQPFHRPEQGSPPSWAQQPPVSTQTTSPSPSKRSPLKTIAIIVGLMTMLGALFGGVAVLIKLLL
jgi:serine/threonine protein kinase